MGEFTAAKLATLPSFINYCHGTDRADAAYWERYLQEHPAKAPMIAEARELVNIGSWMVVGEKEKSAALDRLDAYLAAPVVARSRRRYLPYVAAAASVAALIAAAIFLTRPKHAPIAPVIETAAQNARKNLLLPDSSVVLLEHGALMELENDYGNHRRLVRLEGTAYFKVAQDPRKPFSVLAGEYLITALGTSFRVSIRPDSLQVLLEEGKVKVEYVAGKKPELIAVLGPSDRLDLRPGATAAPQRGTFRAAELHTWKAEEIVFDNTPLTEAVRQLEAVYNIRIALQDFDPKKETFSGRFRNDRLTEVLEVLCFTLNKRYEINEDSTEIIIH
ncbi:FecR family protein [Chitinophaga caseinilytica]|uniref:FecR family protein n=1 Tax=Chitinophaga caseinilytica TaxID=2267521 RepID=UPI003C2BD374